MKKKHYLLIAALSLSLTTAACATTLVACKDDSDNIQIIDSLTGTYYFDDNGTERTMRLELTSFSLDFGDGFKEGVYSSYDQGTLVFDFDNGEQATAVFNSGILTLNYNGRIYTLYRQKEITVTFNVDGGSSVPEQAVMNGKKAVRPATNPTRENSVFIGWYKEAACVTPFDFDTEIITSATTIYAKFITVNAEFGVYEATFDLGEGVDGSISAVKTVNRVLYNLPVLPAKEGNDFLGWWVSDYRDRTKLTYKYDGREIFEDTVLYAVWASDFAAVSVTPEGASWTARGTNRSFDVSIKDAEGNELKRQSGISTSVAFDFGAAAAGDYTVEVTVGGNTTVAYYKNKALARVTKFAVEDDYFGFVPIETKDSNVTVNYYLDIECGTAGHTHERVILGGNGFNFSNCRMTEAGIKFRVTAEANGYAASVSETYTVLRSLEQAKGLVVNDATDTVSWNAVENAKVYNLKFTSGETVVEKTVSATSFDMRVLDAGEWTIEVTPYNTTYNTPETTATTYTKTRLASPVLTFANDTISWEQVSGATGYRVFVNGVKQGEDLGAEETSFAVSQDDADYNEAYGVTVVALKEGEENATSLASDAFYIHGSLEEIAYENGKVSWGAVRGIAKFGVKVGDAEEFTVTANEADILFTKKGATKITVTAYKGDDTAAGSSETTVEVYEVVFNSNGGTAVASQYKADGDTVALPEEDPVRRGYRFVGWFDAEEGGQHLDGNDATEFTFDSKKPTVYALWKGEDYTVTFNSGEGKLPLGAETERGVTFGQGRGENYPVPTIEGDESRVFAGWYTAAVGGSQITDNEGRVLSNWNIAQDTMLYAHWSTPGVIYADDGTGKGYHAMKDPKINNLATITVLEYYNGKPVTGIMANAFNGCASVTKLKIPSSIKDIIIPDEGPTVTGASFNGLTGLKEIEVYEAQGTNEKYYASYNGALYTLEDGNMSLVFVPRGQDVTNAVITVADGTNTIAHHALSGMGLVKEVVIPASVSKIEKAAFGSNHSLDTVTFLDGEGDGLTIDQDAFRSCDALTDITFPKHLASLDPEAFYTSSGTRVLKNIYVNGNSATSAEDGYYSIDGVLFKREGKTDELVLFPAGHEVPNGAYQVPSGVEKIGRRAAVGIMTIKTLKFLHTLEEIGEEAFSGCTNLGTIMFDESPNNSTDLTIKRKAFYGCSALRSIVLPPNLKNLETGAFGNITSLTTVNVNANRDELNYADGAFAAVYTTGLGNSYVETVYLGERVGALNIAGVFGSQVTAVNVDPNNPNYYSEKGVIYDHDVTKILFFPDNKEEFVISDQLKTIGGGVFKGRTSLISITIGTGVTAIEDSAFEGCTSLQTVVFKAGGTEGITIGNRAFYNCTSISTLTFNGRGEGAEITVGDEAFAFATSKAGALSEITLPEGVTEIGNFAFAGRTVLETVNLPSTLTSIPKLQVDDRYPESNSYPPLKDIVVANVNVFRECSYLTNVNVAEGNANYESIDGILFEKEDGVLTTLLFVPQNSFGSLMPDEYKTEEGEKGYLKVPASVTKIADFAFNKNGVNINHSSGIVAGGIKRIEFEGSQGTFTVGNNAFLRAEKLEAVELPSGITQITAGFFEGCKALTEVEIPNTVATIGASAFKGCAALTTVTFEGGNDTLGLIVADGTYSNGDGTVTATGAFTGCTSLRSIEFPARLTAIGNNAFQSGESAGQHSTKYNSKLESVKIPVTATRIGTQAFANCENLKTVIFTGTSSQEKATMVIEKEAFLNCPLSKGEQAFALPETVKSLERFALKGTGLTSLTIPAKLESLAELDIETLETLTFATMTVDGKEVNSLNELPITITNVEDSLFSGMKALRNVNLEVCTSLTEIPVKAFYDTNISSIKIPEQITSIGVSAFENSRNLGSVEFLTDESGKSKVQTIGNFAFRNTGLEEFEFPTLAAGSLQLGSNLFEGCALLTDLTISASVQDIGGSLSKAPNLQNITVHPDAGVIIDAANRLLLGVVSAENKTYKISSAFSALPLDKTGKFTVPSTYTNPATNEVGTIVEIGDGAFTSQNAVRIVHIPSTVTTIGTSAFDYCRGLQKVTFDTDSALTKIGDYAFRYTISMQSMVIPKGVTDIGRQCFYASAIREVTMPDVLTNAGVSIFYSCAYLETVNNFSKLDLSNPVANYDAQTIFHTCNRLRKVTFADGADALPSGAFKNCTSLEEIDLTGITKFINIGGKNYAMDIFSGCSNLREVVLDGNLTVVPSGMFTNCTALTTVYRSDYLAADKGIADETQTYRYQNRDKADLSQILTFTTDSTTSSGSSYGAFVGCSSLLEVDIRNAGTLATHKLFAECSNLKKVTLSPSVQNYKNNTFLNCTSLKTVNYWDGSKIVGNDGEVTFHDNVSFLGQNSFQNSGVEKVTLPYNLTVIGKDGTNANVGDTSELFMGCGQLKEVVLSSKLTALGSKVFKDCTALTTIRYRSADGTVTGEPNKVTLPVGLISVGNYCFMNCSSLSGTIDLSKVATISTAGVKATAATSTKAAVPTQGLFAGCTNIQKVILNDNIELLGLGIFADCTNLEEVHLPANLIATNTYTFYHSGIKKITLPSKVKYLGTTKTTAAAPAVKADCFVFEGCTRLETVTISENFEKTGQRAFYGCSNLTAVTVELDETTKKPKATKFNQVGKEAFYGCSKLETIDLSAVSAFGETPFSGCAALKEADLSSATTLQANMFDGCSALAKVTLGDGITTLPNYAFRNCTSLESIDLNKVSNPGQYAFDGCTGLKNVTLGNCTNLGNYMFRNCTGLTEMNLSGITSIGNYALAGCTKLSAVYKGENQRDGVADLTGVKTIGNGAFQNCKAFISVTLDDGLTTLADTLFSGCSSLTTIALPSTITTISHQAFLNCSSLGELTIPASVTSIGTNVFIGCNRLVLTVEGDKYEVNGTRWLVDKTTDTVLFVPARTEDSENITEFNFTNGTKLSGYMFNGFGAVTKVTLPIDLTEIPAKLFWGFKGSFGADFEIPAGVKSIGNGAFQNSSISEIVIPEGVTSIESNAFSGCTNLTKITLPSTLTSIGANAFDGCTNLSNIVLPSSLPEAGLTIGNEAFKNCSGLSGDIVLPAGIKSVGENAFAGCTQLTGISFGKGLTSFGKVFNGCDALKSVHFSEGLTTIGASAFEGMKGLESVNIPYTVTKIDATAFYVCPNLNNVTFDKTPEGVEEVGLTLTAGATPSATPDATFGYVNKFNVGFKGVFAGCTALKSIELPSRLASVAQNAFTGSGLESVTLPEGLTTIGNYAFMFTPLKSVTVPYTVTSIGTSAFGGCSEMLSLTFAETPEGEEVKTLTVTKGGKTLATSAMNVATVLYDEADQTYYYGAFAGTSKLQEVTLPKRLKEETRANNGAMYMFAFSGVKHVDLAGVKTIVDYMFYKCVDLETISMPEGTELIGDYVFGYCSKVTELNFPESIRQLESGAFAYLNSVKEVVIGMEVKLEYKPFWGWTKEQKVLFNVEGFELYSSTISGYWNNQIVLDTNVTYGVTGVAWADGSENQEGE